MDGEVSWSLSKSGNLFNRTEWEENIYKKLADPPIRHLKQQSFDATSQTFSVPSSLKSLELAATATPNSPAGSTHRCCSTFQ